MTEPHIQPPPNGLIVRAPVVPTYFVDGASDVMLGVPISRIMLCSMMLKPAPGTPGPNTNQLACEIVMPTNALIELAHNILKSVGMSKEEFQVLQDQWNSKTKELIDGTPTYDPNAAQKAV